MRFTALLALLLAAVDGLSLSYRMKSHEPRACFYVPVPDPAALVQIYYSVWTDLYDLIHYVIGNQFQVQ